MDILVFIIVVIAILFIYYLINVIKDLQLEIKNMTLKCNGSSNIKETETIDKKIKNDIVSLLEFIKNFFI
jgi:hypothetical protein